jgi:TRAP-type C4-dicarboxylate transport system substrate-binding protein
MQKLFKLFSISVITCLIAGLAISCGAATPEKKVILRLVTPTPVGDKLTVATEEFAQRFYERTDGWYEIKVYPGEQLAKIPEYLDAVRTGVVEMAHVGWGIFGGLDPRLAEIPMLYNNGQAIAAAQRPTVDLYGNIFEEKLNQKALSSAYTGALEISSKKPLKTMEDWKGLLVGAINPESAALAESLGASPVVVMWTDAYGALEKGTVDACFNGLQWMIVSQLSDVSSYVTRFYGLPPFYGLTINLDIWNDMPKGMQDILIEEAWKMSEEITERQLTDELEEKEILSGMGMEVYDLPKAERERWKAAVAPYVDKKLDDMGEFGDKIREIAEKANADNP